MSRYFSNKYFVVLGAALILAGCQTIPEWDVAMIDNPVEDGKCPDLSGRFNYEHLGANDTRGMDSTLGDTLTSELPVDRAGPSDLKASGAIYMKIYKGRYFVAYPGTVIVTLSRIDQRGRKYHVRVDWDREGLLGEYDFKVNKAWVCSGNKLIRSVKSTLHEWPDPDEIDPKDYRRIYVLPNGNIRIDRKHTFIYKKNPNELFKYYESRVFAKIP